MSPPSSAYVYLVVGCPAGGGLFRAGTGEGGGGENAAPIWLIDSMPWMASRIDGDVASVIWLNRTKEDVGISITNKVTLEGVGGGGYTILCRGATAQPPLPNAQFTRPDRVIFQCTRYNCLLYLFKKLADYHKPNLITRCSLSRVGNPEWLACVPTVYCRLRRRAWRRR